ncbi:hypothetical protein [Ewingella americana]|uniref:hypothetical protein n=1 Tax=Ewingella americana TaxID=41202 RepID=UPI0012ADBD5B|nr:hypothetical protein [Ewingella americana]MRT05913.1 hypothetical protein [Ewingella americana]
MLHLQAQRNLEVFLQRTGVRQFRMEEIMSFNYPDHRLDLAFNENHILMTTSISLEGANDEAFYLLMDRAGKAPAEAVLRIYSTGHELGINGALPDTCKAESWLRLYQTQRTLISYYRNLRI